MKVKEIEDSFFPFHCALQRDEMKEPRAVNGRCLMQHGLSFPVQDAAEAFTAWLERLGHFLPASGFRASPEKLRRAGAGGARTHHLQRASQGSRVQRGNGNDDDFKENKHLKNHPWALSCSTKPKPNDCHSGPIFAAGTLEALDSPSHMMTQLSVEQAEENWHSERSAVDS